jgi:glucose/arabinose dehydrogenase
MARWPRFRAVRLDSRSELARVAGPGGAVTTLARVRKPPRTALLLLVCALGLLVPAGSEAAPTLPADFDDTLIASMERPTAIAFAPDGRVLITSQLGTLRVYKDGALLPDPAIDLSAKVCANYERGLLGVVPDPNFADNHYVYLYYTYNKTGHCEVYNPVNRVSRFVLRDDSTIDPDTETVLIDGIPSTHGYHNAGDLHFGKDGYLYVSVGDGNCDYTGTGNCGALNDAARDLNALVGKVLRITADGGIPPTNPFLGSASVRCNTGTAAPGKQCQEIYAFGLRNPFRIAFDPNAGRTRFFINDVGNNVREEIDVGQAGADYGWNLREGHCETLVPDNCGPPPLGMTNPLYDYHHDTGCTAITGGAFVPDGAWSPAFDGVYLFGDYVCGKIFELTFPNGIATTTEFVTDLGTGGITGMAFGPHDGAQALYYLNYGAGEVHRIDFSAGANRAPHAVATADPDAGTLPLTVDFDGRASSDPDGDPLTYDWDFGDGSEHATGAQPSHTYTSADTYFATLTVSDGAQEASMQVRIDAGNTPPVPEIEAPSTGKLFRVGEEITLDGSANDAEDGALGGDDLSWTALLHHSTHTHPFLPPTAGTSVEITAPAAESLLAATNSYLEIKLAATDSKGRVTTVSQELRPRTVDVTIRSEPAGLRLKVNGETFTTPLSFLSWDGLPLAVEASDQVDRGGRSWRFTGWSDGGAASHTIVTPGLTAAYTATFQEIVARAGHSGPPGPSGPATGKRTVRIGTRGRDRLRGTGGPDEICGRGGDDLIELLRGDDVGYGGDCGGVVPVVAGAGAFAAARTDGDDKLSGGRGDDRLYGGSGADILLGARGDDRLSGESGADVLNGGSGRDLLFGGGGDDRIFAADGRRDVVYCGAGRDVVHGDRADTLRGCERAARGYRRPR